MWFLLFPNFVKFSLYLSQIPSNCNYLLHYSTFSHLHFPLPSSILFLSKTLVRLQVPPGVIATPRETAELAVVSVQCQVCEKILRIRRETTITVALCSTCGERSVSNNIYIQLLLERHIVSAYSPTFTRD